MIVVLIFKMKQEIYLWIPKNKYIIKWKHFYMSEINDFQILNIWNNKIIINDLGAFMYNH